MMVSKQILSAKDQIQCVKLPKLYLRNEIPVDPSEVATPRKLKKWGYLDCVGSKIASDDVVSINVLIGASFTKALEPTDFIASKNEDPYALDPYVLGWCVVRHIENSCKEDDVISCKRITIQDAKTKQISSHHFEIQKEMKDT